ncbi:MAG: phage tail protein, partial [Brevundimonas sp.]|nr:phage tail protein [Brevundimonas sp.]
ATGRKDYPGTGALSENVVSFLVDAVSYTRMGERIRVEISAPNHFGHEDGVWGTIDVYVGSDEQVADDYLSGPGAIGPPLPAYRGLCYAVLRQCYMGNSGQFRSISFVVRRCPDPLGLGPLMSNLNGDANPANVIYDLLTSPLVNQKPVPADQIEIEDFRTVGRALFEEGLGVSLVYDMAAPLGDQIDLVLKHIDALRYTDPETGRIRLKLIRADYELEGLPRLDRGNVLTCKYGRRCWSDTKNVVKLTYRDRLAGFIQRVVQAQDLANIETQDGNLSIESCEFEGFSNADRAQWAAERTLKTVAYPGAPIELTVNRSASRLRPGDAFVLDWEPQGIRDLACRVASVTLGTLRGNSVRIEAIEDIWGADHAAYDPPALTRWTNPV